jgi:hypothetical protein
MIFLGTLIVAAALGGALWLAGYEEEPNLAEYERGGFIKRAPSWADPLAVFIAVAGVGAGAAEGRARGGAVGYAEDEASGALRAATDRGVH